MGGLKIEIEEPLAATLGPGGLRRSTTVCVPLTTGRGRPATVGEERSGWRFPVESGRGEVMTITVPAVYEGDGVLKLERPVDLKENAKVNVTIEAVPEALLTEDQDPTGWKTADRFIGMWNGGAPGEAVGAEHDTHLYK